MTYVDYIRLFTIGVGLLIIPLAIYAFVLCRSNGAKMKAIAKMLEEMRKSRP